MFFSRPPPLNHWHAALPRILTMALQLCAGDARGKGQPTSTVTDTRKTKRHSAKPISCVIKSCLPHGKDEVSRKHCGVITTANHCAQRSCPHPMKSTQEPEMRGVSSFRKRYSSSICCSKANPKNRGNSQLWRVSEHTPARELRAQLSMWRYSITPI